jgi:hypothetical protein
MVKAAAAMVSIQDVVCAMGVLEVEGVGQGGGICAWMIRVLFWKWRVREMLEVFV